MYDYDWMGYGLRITTPKGTLFLQDEDAALLYDELEACGTAEEIENILCEYEDVCGDD